MDGLMQYWATIAPFLLPLLLPIGRQLKQWAWFSNKAIPLTLVAVNFVVRVLPMLGWAKVGEGGQLEPVSLVLAPGVLLGLSFGGALSWLGAGVQLAVDHYMVNNAHKGLKYRAMWKLAQAGGIMPNLGADQVRKQVKW